MKIAWICIFMVMEFLVHAQSDFKKGDQFKKESFSNMNSVIRLGSNNIQIGIESSISQLYSIEEISPNGYIFKVITSKISDSIKSFGEQVYYNSERLKDTTSVIEKAIKSLLNQTFLVQVDKKGNILTVKTNSIEYPSDPLPEILGLFSNSFIKGGTIGLITNYNFNTLQGNRFSNIDSSIINNNKTVTTYSINSQTDSLTVIFFTQKIQGSLTSTNTNGVLMVNNATGMVVEKATKSITAEDQIFNGMAYSIIRKTATIESYKKL